MLIIRAFYFLGLTMSYSNDTFTAFEAKTSHERYDYLLEQVIEQQEVWIMVGDGGSVLLTSDGASCVPIWPNRETAEQWIKGDWSDCTVKAVSLTDWQARWTKGLREDGFDVAVYPNFDQEGIVLSSEEFDDDLIAAMS